ncbi:thiamine diphosphokinase [Dysgonomonas sp. 511]|uniref:thiamine diphosphokinase n=1 Tax=Dysgonomonas sp. 511 TaxID=2302930 RepID=UPI0013D3EDEF|nr:thiamine diphosphokinase [Dysgonomonas sp. 511]NDV78495.1 thiamine diphosphokinase [Dysgonomonas sp. 511]
MEIYKLPVAGLGVDTVILANGEFPSHIVPLTILNNNNYLVCCDGAINSLIKTGLKPDAIVGDCDSLTEENARLFANIVHCIPEQETNDQTKAVNFCVEQGRTQITILGATGEREDHTIANVSLLCEYLPYADVQIISNYGIFTAIDKTATFQSCEGQQVSLFSIDRCTVTTHNLKYPVVRRVFTNWWQASLNEAAGDEFTIETDGRMLVYRAFLNEK